MCNNVLFHHDCDIKFTHRSYTHAIQTACYGLYNLLDFGCFRAMMTTTDISTYKLFTINIVK
jgi:hypothetical protein